MILIIGYGNTLRRDDGAGPALARMIGEKCGDEYVRVIETHQLVPELAGEIVSPDVAAVIFMDACVIREGNAQIREDAEVRELHAKTSSSSFGHHLDPSVLLAYADLLHGSRPSAWLISIPGTDFEYGEGFSETARVSLASALEKALDLIRCLREQQLEKREPHSGVMLQRC